MTQTVAEIISITSLGDDRPGQTVAVLTAHTGLDRIDGGELGPQHDVVNLVESIVRLADHHGAGDIRAIPVCYCSHVDDYGLPGLYGPVRGHMVRHCAIGTAGHDGFEADAVGAKLPHRHFHAPRDFLFSHAFLNGRADSFHSRVRCVDGLLEQCHLFRVFKHSMLFSDAGGRNQRNFTQIPVFFQGIKHFFIISHGHMPAFKSNPLNAGLLELLHQPAPTASHLNYLKVGSLIGGLLGVTGVGKQHGPAGGDEQVSRGPGEPREITAVFRSRDQNRVQISLGQLARHSLQAVAHCTPSSSVIAARMSRAAV